MIVWRPVAVNEKPLVRGRRLLPEYSAAVIGNSVVLRVYTGGLTSVALALTTIPFATASDAQAWIAANEIDFAYDRSLAGTSD